MERIIHFNPGIQIPINISSKHVTLPINSRPSAYSATEDDLEGQEGGLSPLYKKNNFTDVKDQKKLINANPFKINEFKLDGEENADESEANTPDDYKQTAKDLPTNNPKFRSMSGSKTITPITPVSITPTVDTFYSFGKEEKEDNDINIKQLSLFPPKIVDRDREKKKSNTVTVMVKTGKGDPTNFQKFGNNEEKYNSEMEFEKKGSYKEKEKMINNHPYRHLIFSNQVSESTFKRHLMLTYRGLVYAKKCLKGPSDKFIKTKQVPLDGQNEKKKTLLLDLDETLVHACQLKEDPEHVILIPTENGVKISVGINIRPFCLEFLQTVSPWYEIFIFTASSASYSREIISFIDSQNKFIKGILSRENCMETKIGFFIKDLRIIKNRELKDIILVDNLAHSFGFQIDNGVPILEFHNNKKDAELKFLADYLIEAADFNDVREFNRKKMRLNELADMKAEDLEI